MNDTAGSPYLSIPIRSSGEAAYDRLRSALHRVIRVSADPDVTDIAERALADAEALRRGERS